MDKSTEFILRRRMHGLYLSRKNDCITTLAHELLGLHCWFHRNVVFSALIRGADITGWKTALTKTWLYRGTLHGVVYEDLPELLALHMGGPVCGWVEGNDKKSEIAEKVMSLMEDGIYSRAQMRQIFADEYDKWTIDTMFSPWGGIFCELARAGKVAFRDMTSRDFDLISAAPTQSPAEVLPDLFNRYIAAYGPATIDDAAWFFGLQKERKHELTSLCLDEYKRLEHNKKTYYFLDGEDECDIPELTLLSGFDPFVVSYTDRNAVLPSEYKNAVILKSGICLPSIAVNGQIAGIWNIKGNKPTVEFFTEQPKKIIAAANDMVNGMCFKAKNNI